MVPADDGGSPAPIDRPVLELLRERLLQTAQISAARITDEGGHLELRTVLSDAYYPPVVERAVLSVRWYTNDDFKIHYREVRGNDWQCRWDSHPNPHNTHDHFHPPPSAKTPGKDASWPDDSREVLTLVLNEIEDRISDLWD
jgi:hypothetical protein